MEIQTKLAALGTGMLLAVCASAQERAHDREHDPEAATQAQVRAERAREGQVETRAQIGALEEDTDPATIWGDPEDEIRLERIEDDHAFRVADEPALEDEYLADAQEFAFDDEETLADERLSALAPVRVPDPDALDDDR